MKLKKGFTLVELLAVIVILAIILAIAIPTITGIIDNARKDSFAANIKMIITGINYSILEGKTITPSLTDAKSTLGDYGADPSDYSSFYIVDTDPVTIYADASTTGSFKGWACMGATRTSVSTVADTTFTAPTVLP